MIYNVESDQFTLESTKLRTMMCIRMTRDALLIHSEH